MIMYIKPVDTKINVKRPGKRIKMNILLINPWITDFAAYDLWSKPLGLLYTGAFLAERGHSVRLIDCMDRFCDDRGWNNSGHARSYGTGKFHRETIETPACLSHVPRNFCRYGIPVELFRTLASEGPRPDVVLVTCIMTYWYHGAFDIISHIHDLFPGVPVILGGIYAALCTRHAVTESGADAVVAESQPSAIIEAVESIGGKKGEGRITPDEFSGWPEPLWDVYGTLPAAVTMTTRGCPMRCTVCASHRLFNGFERRPPSDAAESIQALTERGVQDIAFYDDALLIDAGNYAMPLFDNLAHAGSSVRLHTPNGLHIREITPELALLMKKAGVVTIRLSLETASSERVSDFSGKVSRDDFLKTAESLYAAGYTTRELGTYILIGLPGQTFEEVLDTIEFVLRAGVKVKTALFSPVPGTVEFNRAVQAGMIHTDDDPVLQNSTLQTVNFGERNTNAYNEFKTVLSLANEWLDTDRDIFNNKQVIYGFGKLREKCI